MSEIPQKILKIIQNSGLSRPEAQAYLALLEIGRGSADSVAHWANLKRATAYVALDSLLKQGLVLKIPRARKMLFIAKDPEELVKQQEEKLSALNGILPSLRILAVDDKQFNTVLYEGLSGIKKALWYKLDEMRDVEYRAFFGAPQKINTDIQELVTHWNKANAKRYISSKAIAPVHPSLKEFRTSDSRFLREVKTVPYEEYPNQNSIEIYEHFVRIVMFDNLAAVIIESPSLANAFSSIHKMLWEKI